MVSSFVAYIDESGDEGFRFEQGSSEWFVLSAVITRKSSDIETVRLVDDVRVLLGRDERKPLHFRDMKHEQRVPYVNAIAGANLRVINVLAHKPSLLEPEKFQERYRLYFYSVRYLLERISWFCRDNRNPNDSGDGCADIIFSNRSGMSYKELSDYLHHLKENTSYFGVNVDWNVIMPDRITSYSPGRKMGLQIADAVAGSFFYGVQKSRYGFTENRYARLLKPIVYHHEGQYRGYGIKIWPREVENLVGECETLEWIKKEYQ